MVPIPIIDLGQAIAEVETIAGDSPRDSKSDMDKARSCARLVTVNGHAVHVMFRESVARQGEANPFG